MADNLEITKQINALLVNQLRLQEQIANSISSQRDLLDAMRETMNAYAKSGAGLDNVAASAKSLTSAMRDARIGINDTQAANEALAEASEKATSASDLLSAAQVRSTGRSKEQHAIFNILSRSMLRKIDVLKQLNDEYGDMAIGAAAATGGAKGLYEGIKNTSAILRVGLGAVGGFVESIFNIGKAIISIPFKMLEGLISLAEEGGGGNELARAYEEVRKVFGSFQQGPASAVITGFKTLNNTFKDSGLGVMQVFGDMAEQLNYIREVADKFGAVFNVIQNEFRDTSGYVLGFGKALGHSAEEMKLMAVHAKSSGTTLVKMQADWAKVSRGMTDANKGWGLSAKMVSREMAVIQKQFGPNYLDTKTIASAAAQMQRLGLSAEQLKSTLDQFDSIEGGAEAASKLAQAFGASVDAYSLMMEEDPAAQFSMIQKSIAEAGYSYESMNKFQRKALADTLKMDDASLRLAFSQDGLSKSYDDVKKEAAKSAAQQISTGEALKRVADQIERLVKDGQMLGSGGFVDRFFQGFIAGIKSTKEFRELMISIRTTLNQTFLMGREVGRIFVDTFGGGAVKTALKSFIEIFDKKKFQQMLGDVRDVFKKFFVTLNLKDLIGDQNGGLYAVFQKVFSDKSPAVNKLLESGKTIAISFMKVFASGLEWGARTLTEGIRKLIDFIKTGDFSLDTSGAQGILMQILDPIIKLIKSDAWRGLWDAFTSLFDIITDKIGDYFNKPSVQSKIKKAMIYLSLAMFGPAVMQSVFAAGAGAFATGIVNLIATKKQEAVAKKAGSAATAAANAGSTAKDLAEQAKDLPAAATAVQQTAKAQSAMSKVKFGAAEAATMAMKLAAVGIVIYIGLVPLAKRVKEAADILKDVSFSSLTKTMITLGGMIVGMAALNELAKRMKDTSAKDIGTALLTIAGITLTFSTNMFIIGVAMKAIDAMGVSPDTLSKGVGIMAKLALAMVPMTAVVGVIGGIIAVAVQSGVGGAAIAGVIGGALAGIAATIGVFAIGITMIGAVFKDMKDDEISKIERGTSLMRSLAVTLGALGLSIIAMSGVGLLTMNPFTFVSIVVGIKAVSAFSEQMVEQVKNLLTKIEQLPEPSVIGPKVKIFVDVVDTFSKFSSSMVSVIELAKPGLGQLYGLIGPSFTDTLSEIGTFVGTTISALQFTIDTIVKKASELNVTAELEKSMNFLTSSLRATSEIMKALTPSGEIIDGAKSVLPKLAGINTLEEVGYFAGSMIQKIGTVIDLIIGRMNSPEFAKITDENLTKMERMGSIMSSFANVLKSIMPSDKMLETLKSSVGGGALAAGIDPNAIGAAGKFISTYLEGMKELLPAMTGGIINSLIAGAEQLTSKDISKIDAISKAITSFGGFISSMSSATKSVPKNVDNADTAFTSIGDVLMGISSSIEGFISTLTSKMNVFELFSQSSGVVGTLESTVQTVKQISTSVSDALLSMRNLASAMGEVATVQMTQVDTSSFAMMSDNIKIISFTLSDSFAADIISASEKLTKIGNAIKSGGIERSLSAVSDMIKRVNELNDTLADGKLNTINVPAKLEAVAKGVGLGGKFNYQIQNKDVVINVNLNVTMEAGKVENVIIKRKSSVIRQHLVNAAYETKEGFPATDLKNEGSLPD
jgi:hypothetical protein